MADIGVSDEHSSILNLSCSSSFGNSNKSSINDSEPDIDNQSIVEPYQYEPEDSCSKSAKSAVESTNDGQIGTDEKLNILERSVISVIKKIAHHNGITFLYGMCISAVPSYPFRFKKCVILRTFWAFSSTVYIMKF